MSSDAKMDDQPTTKLDLDAVVDPRAKLVLIPLVPTDTQIASVAEYSGLPEHMVRTVYHLIVAHGLHGQPSRHLH